MSAAPEMVEGVAVYDPASGKALAVFVDASSAVLFHGALKASGGGAGFRLAPWLVPAEIFEAEE